MNLSENCALGITLALGGLVYFALFATFPFPLFIALLVPVGVVMGYGGHEVWLLHLREGRP